MSLSDMNPKSSPRLGRFSRGIATSRAKWGALSGDPLLRRLFGNASFLLSGKLVNGLLSLGYLAFAARGLGVETFGILVILYTYVQIVGDIVRFQSWQAVLTYGTSALQDGRSSDLRGIVRFAVKLDVIGILSGLGVALSILPFAAPYLHLHGDTLSSAMRYVPAVMFLLPGAPLGILRLFDRFDLLAIHAPLGSLVRFIGAGIAFFMSAGLGAYLAVWFAANVISFSIIVAMSLGELKRRDLLRRQEQARWRADRPVWRFVWSTNLNSTLGVAFSYFGTLAVGVMLGAPAAALYRIAREIAEAMAAPLTLLTPAIYPELARLSSAGDFRGARQFVTRSGLVAGLGASLVAGLIFLIGPWLLRLIAGASFEPAYGVMVLLSLAAALRMWSFPLEPLLISGGRAHTALLVRSLTTVIYLPLLGLLTLQWGIAGAGAAALIATAFMALGLLLAARQWLQQQILSERPRPPKSIEQA